MRGTSRFSKSKGNSRREEEKERNKKEKDRTVNARQKALIVSCIKSLCLQETKRASGALFPPGTQNQQSTPHKLRKNKKHKKRRQDEALKLHLRGEMVVKQKETEVKEKKMHHARCDRIPRKTRR